MDKSQELLEFYISIEPYAIDILNSEDIYRNVWEIIQEFPDEVNSIDFESRIKNEVLYWIKKNEIVLDEEGQLIEVLLEYELTSQIIDDNKDYLDELDEEQLDKYNKNIFKIYNILNKKLYNLCGVEFSFLDSHIRAEGFDEVIRKFGESGLDLNNTSDNILGWE